MMETKLIFKHKKKIKLKNKLIKMDKKNQLLKQKKKRWLMKILMENKLRFKLKLNKKKSLKKIKTAKQMMFKFKKNKSLQELIKILMLLKLLEKNMRLVKIIGDGQHTLYQMQYFKE